MLRLFARAVQLFQDWLKQLQINGDHGFGLRDEVTGLAWEIGDVIRDTVQAFPRLEGAVLLGLAMAAAVAHCLGA